MAIAGSFKTFPKQQVSIVSSLYRTIIRKCRVAEPSGVMASPLLLNQLHRALQLDMSVPFNRPTIQPLLSSDLEPRASCRKHFRRRFSVQPDTFSRLVDDSLRTIRRLDRISILSNFIRTAEAPSVSTRSKSCLVTPQILSLLDGSTKSFQEMNVQECISLLWGHVFREEFDTRQTDEAGNLLDDLRMKNGKASIAEMVAEAIFSDKQERKNDTYGDQKDSGTTTPCKARTVVCGRRKRIENKGAVGRSTSLNRSPPLVDADIAFSDDVGCRLRTAPDGWAPPATDDSWGMSVEDQISGCFAILLVASRVKATPKLVCCHTSDGTARYLVQFGNDVERSRFVSPDGSVLNISGLKRLLGTNIVKLRTVSPSNALCLRITSTVEGWVFGRDSSGLVEDKQRLKTSNISGGGLEASSGSLFHGSLLSNVSGMLTSARLEEPMHAAKTGADTEVAPSVLASQGNPGVYKLPVGCRSASFGPLLRGTFGSGAEKEESQPYNEDSHQNPGIGSMVQVFRVEDFDADGNISPEITPRMWRTIVFSLELLMRIDAVQHADFCDEVLDAMEQRGVISTLLDDDTRQQKNEV